MSIYPPLIWFGLLLIMIGALMLFLSLKTNNGRGQTESKVTGIIFIGPIPIVLGGKQKWVIICIFIIVTILFLFSISKIKSNLFGW